MKNNHKLARKRFVTVYRHTINVGSYKPVGNKYSRVENAETFVQCYLKINVQKTHGEVKPYSCEMCMRSFARGFHLTERARTRSGKRPVFLVTIEEVLLLRIKLVRVTRSIGSLNDNTNVFPICCINKLDAEFERKRKSTKTDSKLSPYDPPHTSCTRVLQG